MLKRAAQYLLLSTLCPIPIAFASAPQPLWTSQPVAPGESVVVALAQTSDKSKVELSQLPNDSCGGPLSGMQCADWKTPAVALINGVESEFQVPADWPVGMYSYRIQEGTTWSDPAFINKAEVWFIQGDKGKTATPGGWLQVHGKALSLPGKQYPWIALVSNNKIVAKVPASGGKLSNTYRQRFTLPDNLPEGSYKVYVSNGYGGAQGWTLYSNQGSFGEQIETINIAKYTEPTKEILVKDQEGNNWDEKMAAALKQAASQGGAIVTLPEGYLYFNQQIRMPENSVLRGAGQEKTYAIFAQMPPDGCNSVMGTMLCGQPLPGDKQAALRVSDLTLYSGQDIGTCAFFGRTDIPGYMRRVNCVFPNQSGGDAKNYWKTFSAHPLVSAVLLKYVNNVEISDSSLDCRGGVQFVSQAANTSSGYLRMERNKVRYRDNDYRTWGGNENVIYENNTIIYAGNWGDNGYTAAMNANPGLWFSAYASNTRDLYFGNNVNIQEDRTVAMNGSQGITVDGNYNAYKGGISVNGDTITLASVPNEGGNLSGGSFVAIIDGLGKGQWRTTTDRFNGKPSVKINAPFTISPDQTSVAVVSRFIGRGLFVYNDFAARPYFGIYYPSVDIVFAYNTNLGGNMAGQNRGGSSTHWGDTKGLAWNVEITGNQITSKNWAFTNYISLPNQQIYGQVYRNNYSPVGITYALRPANGVASISEGNKGGN